jgi:hypothetical protein
MNYTGAHVFDYMLNYTIFVPDMNENKFMKKAILNRITQINALLPEIKKLDETPCTYDGGTWPFYIDINGIDIKNQFVYIRENKSRNGYGFEKRYNVNKEEGFGSLEELKWALSLILKTFKKEIKKQS